MRIVTFGELMLRLQPEGNWRFVQVDRLTATFGGAEANVAVSLANFGAVSVFVSKLPCHEIGQSALNCLRRYGVDTSFILRGGERLGIYFNEKGASQRPSKCIYDRKGSAISQSTRGEFDWQHIFGDDTDWFHFSGVTPALGAELPAICLDACKAARERHIGVSCDLNYRSKLWSKEAARQAMEALAPFVDVCISNEEDARDVFGIEASGSDIAGGHLDKGSYKSVARQLAERYGFKQVAITLRTSVSASFNKWSALLFDGKDFFFSREYDMTVVDRLGGGDSFCAGLIFALLKGEGSERAVEFASAASCLKHSVEGDFNMASVEEVERLASGDASGRILR